MKNSGISFSLFGQNTAFIILINICILITLLWLLLKKQHTVTSRLSFILIIVGGSSNLIERIQSGYVWDYIKIWQFPVFNPADIAIALGMILFLYDQFRTQNYFRR